ncbi:MAG: metallophosphoesterase family protein [Gaiellales bacterium]
MTVRVLVTSDTHVSIGARLPTALLELADRADHVIHAGDHITLDAYDTIAALAPVTAVHGNVDDAMTCLKLPDRAEVELGGVRLGIVHVPGPESGRRERLAGWFPECDVIIYGHTHMPELRHIGEVDGRLRLLINPGSPTQRRRASTHTVCWLELRAGEILVADLIHLDDPEPASSGT